MLLPRRLATAIVVIVSIVWVVNFGAQFVSDTYHPDISINGIFMAVVGGALALSRKGKNDDDRDDDRDDDGDGDDGGDEPPRLPRPPPRREVARRPPPQRPRAPRYYDDDPYDDARRSPARHRRPAEPDPYDDDRYDQGRR